ncbi:sensor domain-containing diguanylate cyclase [Ureibacillus endophyticus]|uniref:Diguanylate cyclase n=1 Tax=Ureibacillus endophyticus TaxID=1978490 RepID=A0A494YVN7_9BACL|nr:diguanylate cyclase [Lysinibacillus endophyticus]RKQ14216.1 diguanylate cyclase [Lysinibacillus endophyticus]
MWIVFSSILMIGFLLQYRQKVKLQKTLDSLKPMIETVENIRDMLYYCETYPKLNYLYVSPSIKTLIGSDNLKRHLKNPELIFEIVHPDDYETLMKKKLGTLDFNQPITVRFKNRLGQYIWFEEHATPVYRNGKFVGIVGVFRDIDERLAIQRQLEYNSTHDALTEMYNWAYFQLKLNEFNELDVPITVVVADLDDLKPVNDKYGHKMGDQLIREAANRLKALAKKETIIARIGGDEFAILIPQAGVQQVEQFIKNIQESMKQVTGNLPFSPIHLSIGYKHSNSSYGVMEHLLAEADAIMYQNKKSKKAVATFF